MKILIVADEVWNDQIHGNNVLTNWFTGFDAQFAEVYCSPGIPQNGCCEQYFQLTDMMMVKSLCGKRAGRSFCLSKKQMQCDAEIMPKKFYAFMKSIASDSIRVIRDLIWISGRYDRVALQKFIADFAPDIIFCPRLLTPKLLRLEHTISQMTNAPIVAFTGDDEASLQEISYSPIYWIRRILFHRSFGNNMKIYSHYFMHSEVQAAEYQHKYKLPTSTLFKCGNFEDNVLNKQSHIPIKLVYAGRLYCNRWKTLSAIGDALKIINAGTVEKIILEVYTQEKMNNRQKKALSIEKHIYLKGCVPPSQLKEIYNHADIALHVESFDKRYMYATRYSFSTKIIDLMASSCAVMAICPEIQTGFRYLKERNAAFCISSYNQILPTLEYVCNHPEQIAEIAGKSWECGLRNHNRKMIQEYIRNRFEYLMK